MLGVVSSFFQQFRHRFVSFLVNFFSAVESAVMAVPITPPKLVHSLRLNIETVDRKFTIPNALPCIVQLTSDMLAVSVLFTRDVSVLQT